MFVRPTFLFWFFFFFTFSDIKLNIFSNDFNTIFFFNFMSRQFTKPCLTEKHLDDETKMYNNHIGRYIKKIIQFCQWNSFEEKRKDRAKKSINKNYYWTLIKNRFHQDLDISFFFLLLLYFSSFIKVFLFLEFRYIFCWGFFF